jgi:DNA-binding transcriptional MerR regulator
VEERSHLAIGEVLTLLREEFPDVTISKIRFLESQGLVDPERTPSGYRKFYDADVARLRWILLQQKENFLPLKVIKDRLGALDAAGQTDFATASSGGTAGRGAARRASVGAGTPGGIASVAPSGREPAQASLGLDSTAVPPGEPARSHTGPENGTAARAVPASVRAVTETARADADLTGRRLARHETGEAEGVTAERADQSVDRAPDDQDRASARRSLERAARGPSSPTGPAGRSPAEQPPPGARPAARAGSLPRSSTGWPLQPTGSRGPSGGGRSEPGAAEGGSPAGTDRPPAEEARAGEEGRTERPTPAPAPPRGASVGTPVSGARSEEATLSGSVYAKRPVGGVLAALERERAEGRGASRPAPAEESSSPESETLTLVELAAAAGLDVAAVNQLQQFGLIVPSGAVGGTTYFDGLALEVARSAAAFGRHGVEARHLRAWRNSAEREVSLFEQVIMPLVRQRNPAARAQAEATLDELAALGADLRAALVRQALRSIR